MSNPTVADRVLATGAARVTKINAHTRDIIASAIATGVAQDVSVLDIADAIDALASGDLTETDIMAELGLSADTLFGAYRAEMIARTEVMNAYNAAALTSYQDANVGFVQATDGDMDEVCASRNGTIYQVDDAFSIEDHPNGTLDWIPIVDYSQFSGGFGG